MFADKFPGPRNGEVQMEIREDCLDEQRIYRSRVHDAALSHGPSGGNRLSLLEIGQLRRECRLEGRPHLAARLIGYKIGMPFE
jgi:hypothetical protein